MTLTTLLKTLAAKAISVVREDQHRYIVTLLGTPPVTVTRRLSEWSVRIMVRVGPTGVYWEETVMTPPNKELADAWDALRHASSETFDALRDDASRRLTNALK